MIEVTYDGPFTNLRGVEMTHGVRERAEHLASTCAAACSCGRCTTGRRCCSSPAMVAHMFRTFFTGAFRKPREANWVDRPAC